MVDREARGKVAAAVRAYMASEIGSHDLDHRIFEVHDGPTADRTVCNVVVELWGSYYDFNDREIAADRAEWDYFNRLLLLLGSDAELKVVSGERSWVIAQAGAALGLRCSLPVSSELDGPRGSIGGPSRWARCRWPSVGSTAKWR
jgi:hypothetical protein